MSTAGQKIIYRWLINVQYWLLPGTCILCRRDSGRPRDLCPACESTLPAVRHPCRRCGLPLPPEAAGETCGTCLVLPPPFTRLLAPYAYNDVTAPLIAAFKYRGRLVNGRILSTCLARHLRTRYTEDDWPELLIPAPLHGNRLRKRGFNQAAVIAGFLARELRIPVAQQLLRRHKKTPPQTGLSARERQRNLRRAFAVHRDAGLLRDRTVAIIDDVVTTGSTVSEISGTLLKAGAREVHVWALARTCL